MIEGTLRAVAGELHLDILSIEDGVAIVDLPQSRAQGELIVVPTEEKHPLFDEYRVQERVFRVMKDYRFFQLCLPAVFGMGCVDQKWDWVLRKRYVGRTYESAPFPHELAREMAMIVFDLSQVPVLKFKKDVKSVNYTEEIAQFRNTYPDEAQQLSDFFARAVPTLYCITNGACLPEYLTHLDESILLRNWMNARIVALEEIVAELVLHIYPDTEWIELFMRELANYVDVQPEWFAHMLMLCGMRTGKCAEANELVARYSSKI